MRSLLPASALWLAGLAGCRIELGPPEGGGVASATDGAPSGEVWIYTSMYPSVIDAMEPGLKARFPEVDVQWFQAGSEKIAQRVEAEWEAGGSQACLLLTSDPFWYLSLEARGVLAPHLSPDVLRVERALVDEDGTWAATRLSLAVLAVNPSVPVDQRPTAFAELTEPRFRDRVAMPDPMASGSAFTWLAFLVHDLGWGYVDGLRANGVIAAGGSAAVLSRVQTGERPIGVLLLENVLAAGGEQIEAIYPSDGAVLIPGPIALTAGCQNPTAARAVYDWIASDAGQAVIVDGNMYGASASAGAPRGARPLGDVVVRPWTVDLPAKIVAEQDAIKERWTAR